MGEGGVGMSVWECLGPWVKGFRGWVCVSIGGNGWNGLGVGVCVWALAPLSPHPYPHPHVCFVLFNGLNHDMNHDSEPRHLNHDVWTTMNHDIASFAGGSQWQECTVLENLPGYRPPKRAGIAVLGLILVSQGICLVAGFEKSVEIAILGIIRVSQESWKLLFVILVKYFIILSNFQVGNNYIL